MILVPLIIFLMATTEIKFQLQTKNSSGISSGAQSKPERAEKEVK